MPRTLFLSEAERARLETFPETISQDDIAAYFALSRRDLMLIRQQRGDAKPPRLRRRARVTSLPWFRPSKAG